MERVLPAPRHTAVEAAPVWTLGDLLDHRAATYGDRDAVVFPHERISFRQLAEGSDAAARGLLALGAKQGDRVGILLPNCVESLIFLFAAMKIGAVPVPVNSRFKETELRQVITHSGMRILITTAPASGKPEFRTLLHRAFPELCAAGSGPLALAQAPELRHVVALDGQSIAGMITGADFRIGATSVLQSDVVERQRLVCARDTAVIVYTSGTTAMPKGAMISHAALSAVSDGIVHHRFHMSPDDRVWTALPLFHIGGIAFAIASLYGGAAYCHIGAFEPAVALHQLEAERCTIALAGFETIWLPVLGAPGFAAAQLDSIRIVMVVGVPERLRIMQDRLPGAVQVSTFGQTEAGSFLSLNLLTDSFDERMTTGGPPLPGMRVRIVSTESGEDLPAGAPGELLYRGTNMFDGYFRDPEQTAASIDADGWFHSGDVATVDAEGRVSFVGRIKDMLKVGGENVAAAEVEDFLVRHPAVGLVQVVAAPDAHYVEVPAAFIELAPGADATEDEIIDYCLGRIATFRVPRYVRFVTEWPMSGTKIKKYVLRERIAEELRAKRITSAPKLVAPRTVEV